MTTDYCAAPRPATPDTASEPRTDQPSHHPPLLGMDHGSLPKPGKHGRDKEVLRELAEKRGRGSPESGSLYSDYESGQQYEDKVGLLTTKT